MYQEYDNPTYHDYRAEAQIQARLRHEAFQKAAAAWRSNKKDLASYYAAQVCYQCPASFDVVRCSSTDPLYAISEAHTGELDMHCMGSDHLSSTT